MVVNPWVIAYGAAILIAAIIDYCCDTKIADDVAECTRQGKCSKDNSCSATCVVCNKN